MVEDDIPVEGDPFDLEAVGHQFAGFRVFPRKETIPTCEEGDLGTEAAEGLGEFAGDWTGAEDDEVAGKGGEVEDVLVGEDACLGKARDVGE
jgi:hypothetical protein